MKIKLGRRRRRGGILLAILALILFAGILYIGWKIIDKLLSKPFDPHHGQGTNIVDTSWARAPLDFSATHPGEKLTVQVTQFNLTLPVEALAHDWHINVQSSTNLVDWQHEPIDWDEAVDVVRTNHSSPRKFYRRILWW